MRYIDIIHAGELLPTRQFEHPALVDVVDLHEDMETGVVLARSPEQDLEPIVRPG